MMNVVLKPTLYQAFMAEGPKDLSVEKSRATSANMIPGLCGASWIDLVSHAAMKNGLCAGKRFLQ